MKNIILHILTFRKKMWVLSLEASGEISQKLIAKLTGVSPNTIRTCFNEYITDGVDGLKKVNFYKPQSKLVEHQTSIEQYFKNHQPSTVSEAVSKIEELTGIKRGFTQTARFMKKTGLKLQKVGSIPAKATTDEKKEQIDFLLDDLIPKLNEAKNGGTYNYWEEIIICAPKKYT